MRYPRSNHRLRRSRASVCTPPYALDQLICLAFAHDPDFNLEAHATRAFGSFHADEEFAEVIWRFAPKAAAFAREFIFHPLQEVTDELDGSLTVRFHASGHLEMAWHLYLWGDAVEVLAPDRLREMVSGFQRGDFPSLP